MNTATSRLYVFSTGRSIHMEEVCM